MNQNDFRPAGDFANLLGFKAIVYGAAGTGKTPIVNTAPRPMLLATEPGLLSMRGSTVPTYIADTAQKIEEFFKWFNSSAEVKNYDTLAIDSTSQMCDIYLKDAHKKGIKHGLQQYGYMAEEIYKHMYDLYFAKNKHIYLIAKEELAKINGGVMRRPYYQGNFLPIQMPHLYDGILHLATVPIPNVGEVLAFRCKQSFDVMARDRSGKLNEFEPPDFGAIVKKVMS